MRSVQMIGTDLITRTLFGCSEPRLDQLWSLDQRTRVRKFAHPCKTIQMVLLRVARLSQSQASRSSVQVQRAPHSECEDVNLAISSYAETIRAGDQGLEMTRANHAGPTSAGNSGLQETPGPPAA
jgi:hypothetical protein